jgi:hypothetical protein
MRSVLAAIALLFCAAFASAQVHGIPASVSSPTSQNGSLQPHGIPASVTSLGPRGFADDGVFIPSQFHDRRIGRHGFVSPIVFPVAIPFFLAVPQPIIIEAAAPQPQPRMPEHVEVVIRDERGRELPRPAEAAPGDQPQPSSPAPAAAPQPEPQAGPVAVIVFRDGKKVELKDYAIIGADVFNLADGRPRKLSLVDVDEAATARANDEIGSAFHLPTL